MAILDQETFDPAASAPAVVPDGTDFSDSVPEGPDPIEPLPDVPPAPGPPGTEVPPPPVLPEPTASSVAAGAAR